MTTQALAQTNMFGILDANTNRVFKANELKNKDGNVVGASMTLRGRKEIATQLDLSGRDNKDALDTAMLKERDDAFRRAKAHIAGLNGDTTLAKFAVRKLANGIVQTTLITHEVKRGTNISDEQVSKAWNIPLGEVAAFRKMMEENAKAQADSQIEAESTVTSE